MHATTTPPVAGAPASVALVDAALDDLAEFGAPVSRSREDAAAPPPAPSSPPVADRAAPVAAGSSIEDPGHDATAARDDGAGDAEEPDDLRNLEETADILGVSPPTVRTWIKDGCPVFERGTNGVGYKLSVRAVHAWRQGLVAAAAADKARRDKRDEQLRFELFGGQSVADKFAGAAFAHLSPKQRLELIDAERKATELEERRGRLVVRAALDLTLANAFAAVGARIDAAADEIGAELALDADQVDRIRVVLDNVRNDAADEIQRAEIGAPR